MGQNVLAGYRILTAEDDVITQRVVSEVLKNAGAEVVAVDNGRDAVESALSTGPFDAILMDVRMPELDGLTATRQLRLADYDRPIVALTSLSDEAHRRRCLIAGCDEYIALPSEPNRIVKALVGIIRRWKNTSQVEA